MANSMTLCPVLLVLVSTAMVTVIVFGDAHRL
jgi:hypothetical protein